MPTPSPFDLSGRSAVVTGASSGIGQAIAIALVNAGADIVGLSLDDGAETAAAISEREGRSVQLVGDTSSPADVERAADVAVDSFGRLDIWVNNAARLLVKPFLETTEQDWADLLAPNLLGYVWGCRAAARRAGARGRGVVAAELGDAAIFLASDASRYVTGHELLVDGGLTINGSVGHART